MRRFVERLDQIHPVGAVEILALYFVCDDGHERLGRIELRVVVRFIHYELIVAVERVIRLALTLHRRVVGVEEA